MMLFPGEIMTVTVRRTRGWAHFCMVFNGYSRKSGTEIVVQTEISGEPERELLVKGSSTERFAPGCNRS